MYLCIDAISNQQKDNNNELKKTKKAIVVVVVVVGEGDNNRTDCNKRWYTLQTQSHKVSDRKT